jgi:hypothetical protein
MGLLPEQISAQISYLERQRAKSMRLSIPCVRRIGGCPNRPAKARVFPSDPAIRARPEIFA